MNHTTTPNAGSATGIDLARDEALKMAEQAGFGNYSGFLMPPRPTGHITDEVLALIALARATPHYTELADAYARGCADARALDAATPQHPRPTDGHLWDETMRDRDQYHEWADKLAGAIATHFGVDIGEHSNMNCPWAEALEAIENAPPPGDNTLLASAYASFSAAVEKHIPRTAAAATPQHRVTEQADPAIADFEKWIQGRGPLGPGATPDRPFIAGWLAGNRRAQPLASTAATQPEQASAGPWTWERRADAAEVFIKPYADTKGEYLAGDYSVQPIIRRLAAAIQEWQLAALAIPASTAASEQQASVSEAQCGLHDICKEFGWRTDGDVSVLTDRLMHHIRELKASIKARDAALSGRATIPSEADERARDALTTAATLHPMADVMFNTGYAGSSWVKNAARLLEHYTALTHRATTATPGPLTDAQIIAALHAQGIDTYPSKYGFDAVQVSATSVPSLRKVIERLAAASDIATTAAITVPEYRNERGGVSGYGVPVFAATTAADQQADCHPSCGYIGSECDYPACKSTAADQQSDTASASGWEGLPPIGERESIMDVCGLPKLMRAIIETKGSPDSLTKLYDFVDAWGDARFSFAQQSAARAQPVAYVNGDELDNMLDDRTATIESKRSGWRRTPLYAGPVAAQAQAGEARDVEPDMIWWEDDPEVFANGPDEFAKDYASNCLRTGEEVVVHVDCATRSSKRAMRIAVVEGDDDDEVVWKWVDRAAMAAPATSGGGNV